MQRRRYSWTSCSLPMPRTSSSTASSRVVLSRTARSTASRVSVVYGHSRARWRVVSIALTPPSRPHRSHSPCRRGFLHLRGPTGSASVNTEYAVSDVGRDRDLSWMERKIDRAILRSSEAALSPFLSPPSSPSPSSLSPSPSLASSLPPPPPTSLPSEGPTAAVKASRSGPATASCASHSSSSSDASRHRTLYSGSPRTMFVRCAKMHSISHSRFTSSWIARPSRSVWANRS